MGEHPSDPMRSDRGADHTLRIDGILQRGRFTHSKAGTVVEWAPGDRPEAFRIAIDLGARVSMKDQGCPSCSITVANTLLTHMGLPPLVKAAPHSITEARLRVCHGCEYLAKETRLKTHFPFFEWAGVNCTVCGCVVRAKAALKGQKCPKDKWNE